MAKSSSKRALKWVGLALVVVAVAILGFRYWKSRKTALPEGIVSGNGRIEAKLVDVAAREPLRVKEVKVDEGALVQPGQVLVQMDTETLQAQLAEANASIAAAEEKVAVAEASITKVKSDIELAGIELKRSENLVKQGAGVAAGIWTSAGRTGDAEGRARRGGSDPEDRAAGGRGRSRQRGNGPDAHQRRDPQVTAPGESCIGWPNRARSFPPAARH